MPKNPIIAHAFSQIGLAEELGSGMRRLARYSRPFLGADPTFEEGDVFVACIPRGARKTEGGEAAEETSRRECDDAVTVASGTVSGDATSGADLKPATLSAIRRLLDAQGEVKLGEAAAAAGVRVKTARKYLAALVDRGAAAPSGDKRISAYRKGDIAPETSL